MRFSNRNRITAIKTFSLSWMKTRVNSPQFYGKLWKSLIICYNSTSLLIFCYAHLRLNRFFFEVLRSWKSTSIEYLIWLSFHVSVIYCCTFNLFKRYASAAISLISQYFYKRQWSLISPAYSFAGIKKYYKFYIILLRSER